MHVIIGVAHGQRTQICRSAGGTIGAVQYRSCNQIAAVDPAFEATPVSTSVLRAELPGLRAQGPANLHAVTRLGWQRRATAPDPDR